MGVSCSLDRNGNRDDVTALCSALKNGQTAKAAQLLGVHGQFLMEAVPQAAKAVAMHKAVKHGHVNTLEFLNGALGDQSLSRPVRSFSANDIQAAAPTEVQRRRTETLHENTPGSLNARSWIDVLDRRGRTPLMTAVQHNRPEVVRTLVALGADPWVGERGAGRRTALHLAAWLGHAPLVSELLRSHVPNPGPPQLWPNNTAQTALCNIQDAYGFTPLHYAVSAGHADVACVLLAAGASIVAANHAATDAHAPAGSSKPRNQRSRHPRPVAALQHQVLLLQGQRHVPCAAARSNPLHLAAARGDAVCASLLLQRHLELTDGLSRAAVERLPDPRTQLNKDGFQPYMLAGNAGHWHVAQMLIPQSRDFARSGGAANRDRDLLRFFPLPYDANASARDGATAARRVGGSVTITGGDVGPASLKELAAAAWCDVLLAGAAKAEAAVRQQQQQRAAAAAGLADAVGGGRAFSTLVDGLWQHLRRGGGGGGGEQRGKASLPGGAAEGTDGHKPARGLAKSVTEGAASATKRKAQHQYQQQLGAGEAVLPGQGTELSAGDNGSIPPAAAAALTSVVQAAGASPRSSLSGAARDPSITKRSPPFLQLLSLPRRPSLDNATAGAAIAIPAAAAIAAPALRGCDICFEAPQELQLLPCPHRMCASCARRVVQMHTAKQAAPRCPFCQANIKGLAPVPLAPGLERQQQQQQQSAPLVLPTRRSFHASRSHVL